MEWGAKIWLASSFLIPVTIAFVIIGLFARRSARQRFLRGERPSLAPGWKWQLLLLPIAVALITLALADPRWGDRDGEVSRAGVDIIVVLDLSRSMLAEDAEPSRLGRAKREVRGLLSALGDDRIGLLTFAGTAEIACPLTEDHRVFRHILEDASVHSLVAGGSNLAGALELAVKSFDERGAGRAVVLVTDGEFQGENPRYVLGPIEAAKIPLYVVGVGTTDGAKIPVETANGATEFLSDGRGREVISRVDAEMLADIAEKTGGAFLSTQDTAFPADEIYEKRIRYLSASSYGSAQISQIPSRFQWPLLLALALLQVLWFPRRLREVVLAGVCLVFLVGAAEDEDAKTLYNEGTRLHQNEEYRAADAALQDALKKLPTGADDPLLRRDTAYNLGNNFYRTHEKKKETADKRAALESAVRAYATALFEDPRDEWARHNLALTLQQLRELPPPSGGGGGGKNDDKAKGGGDDPDPNAEGQAEEPQKPDKPQEQMPPKAGDRQIDQALDEAEETQRRIEQYKEQQERRRRARDW